MKYDNRANEILSQITACSKDSYTKAEFLPELLKLQWELVNLTFNEEHAESGDLRLWDVDNHLRKMNEARGYIANDELDRFTKGSKKLGNTISAEISGNIGEQKVFRELERLECQNGVLHNVELEFGGRRTEIDAIVFTNRAIFIIEIKNSKKDIFIDENGDFYRTGNSMHYDCNIADKMDEREALLRKALERSGVDHLKIFKIVAFTNNHIDVENKCHRYIKVCYSNYLPSFIEKFKSDYCYSYEDICTMMEAVTEVKCKEAYQMSINMQEFKADFAKLMAILETTDDPEPIEIDDDMISEHKVMDKEITNNTKGTFKRKHMSYKLGGGMAAAFIGFALVNAALYGIDRITRR